MLKVFFIRMIFWLFLISFGWSASAQQKTLNFSSLSDSLFFKSETSPPFFSLNQKPVFISQDYSFSKSVDMIKRPAFCRMEDKLHKRFNVWITLRAGSDADYRKLIAFPEK